MKRWLRQHPAYVLAVVGYLILAYGVVDGFHSSAENRAEGRRQACEAIRVDRVTLGKVIDAAIPPQTARQPAIDPALDPALRKLIEDSRARSVAIRHDIGGLLAEPIELCRHTGVDPSVHLSALRLP